MWGSKFISRIWIPVLVPTTFLQAREVVGGRYGSAGYDTPVSYIPGTTQSSHRCTQTLCRHSVVSYPVNVNAAVLDISAVATPNCLIQSKSRDFGMVLCDCGSAATDGIGCTLGRPPYVFRAPAGRHETEDKHRSNATRNSTSGRKLHCNIRRFSRYTSSICHPLLPFQGVASGDCP